MKKNYRVALWKGTQILERYYSAHRFSGLFVIPTPRGSAFYDMATDKPETVFLDLCEKFDADYLTVLDWLRALGESE